MPDLTLESLAARVAALERAVGFVPAPQNGTPAAGPSAANGAPKPTDAAPEAEPIRPGSFLAKWAGAVRTDVPDWTGDHDRHLGEAQYRDMAGGGDDGVR